jgi:hypothetical protein
MRLRQRDVEAAEELQRRCLADPLYFSDELLPRRRWQRQADIRTAIAKHRYTHIRSANGVGKTNELAALMCEYGATRPFSRTVVTCSSFNAGRDTIWKEFLGLYESARVPLGGRIIDSECTWEIAPGWDVAICNPEKPDSLQGRRGAEVLLIVDEAQNVRADFVAPLKSLMTAEASRMVMSGNPLYASGAFREAAYDPETWHLMRIDGLEHPNVVTGTNVFPRAITRLWVAERLKEYGSETDPRYVARVRGDFPTAASLRQVIALQWLENCAEIVPPVTEQFRMGVDLARAGGDANAITILDEHRRVVHHETWHEDDTQVSIGHVMSVAKDWGVVPENIAVDACGLGGPIVDQLWAAGWSVEPVDFGAGPEYEWIEVTGQTTEFVNRRAELYWVARELLRLGLVSIPRGFAMIWRDLQAVERKPEPSDGGRIKLEPKEDVRKRIGRSPDSGDSFVLALSNVRRCARAPRFV